METPWITQMPSSCLCTFWCAWWWSCYMEATVYGCDHYTVFTKVSITILTLQMVKLSGRIKSDLPGLISRTRWQREESDCSVKVMFIMLMMLVPSFSEWILHTLLLLLLFLKTIVHLFAVSFTCLAPVIVPFVRPKADLVLKNVHCAVHTVPLRLLGKCVSQKHIPYFTVVDASSHLFKDASCVYRLVLVQRVSYWWRILKLFAYL